MWEGGIIEDDIVEVTYLIRVLLAINKVMARHLLKKKKK